MGFLIFRIGFFCLRNPHVGTEVECAGLETVVAIKVVARVLRTKGCIAGTNGIAFVLQAIVEDVFVANGVEFRVGIPQAINEAVVVFPARAEQAIAQINVSLRKIADRNIGGVSINDAIIERGFHQGIVVDLIVGKSVAKREDCACDDIEKIVVCKGAIVECKPAACQIDNAVFGIGKFTPDSHATDSLPSGTASDGDSR